VLAHFVDPSPSDTTTASDRVSLPPMRAEPVAHPVMVQRWTDVVFLHWRFERDVVQALLPEGVTVDVYDGSAWVGLVPFQMERLGLPGLAPLPHVGRFPEVNVRTYVRAGDRRGVWFFSLDIDRLLPAAVARAAYHLPYCSGRAGHLRAGDLLMSRVERRWPRRVDHVTSEIVVRTGSRLAPDDPLVRFLTARWGLISATPRGRLRYASVDHPAWPLHAGEVVHLDDSLIGAAGLPTPSERAHVMWSPGVDVRVGRPHRIRQRVTA
jgi:uncharacterized protein YqjF (DUF2071 family)